MKHRIHWDRDLCAKVSAFIAVPVILFLIDWLSRLRHSPETEFLLVPPLAVIIYLIFLHPDADYTEFRSIVITPIVGAAVGQFCYRTMGLTPWGVAVATLLVLIASALLRSYMPPALALAVLAMLLRALGISYTIGVGLAALLVYLIFIVWRHLLWGRLPPPRRSDDLTL